MKIRKWIAYSYASSHNAKILGKPGYHVAQSILREDDTWSPPYLAQGYDVFDTIDDPDLIQLLKECEGEYNERWCNFWYTLGYPAM